jgi:hypothetical protein
MAFQSVPDTAQFTARFAGPDGTTPSFSLYCRDTADVWDGAQLTVIANALRDAIISDYLPALPSDHTFVRITSRVLEDQFGLVQEEAAVNQVGGLASPSLPAEVSVRATFIGAPGGAPRRGGIFLLPPGESQVVGNLLTAGAAGDLLDAVTAFKAAMDTGAGSHVIVSRYNGMALETRQRGDLTTQEAAPVKRAVAVTNTVSSVAVGSRVDSQKKRRPAE